MEQFIFVFERNQIKINSQNITLGFVNELDVNGAFNILRKGLNVNAEVLLPGVSGFVFNPTRVKVTNICRKPRPKVIKK